MALVLMPLLALLLGIVEFGRVYSMQLRLQHAAREVAREIALHYDDPGLLDLNALVDDTLNDLLGDLADELDTDITMCSTTAPVDDAIVNISTEVQLAVPLPDGGTLDAFDVAAGARMPCEG